jgi:acylglycerol lipase
MVSKGVIGNPENGGRLRPQARRIARLPVDRPIGRMIRLAAGQSMIASPVSAGREPARRLCCWCAVLLVPLLLANCGPAGDTEVGFASFAPRPVPETAAAPAHFTDTEFIADDGVRLPLRKWLPKGRAVAVILALHGFGDYSNGFTIPAPLWAERGIATYAFDQRGFGGAPGRGLWAGEGRLALDAIVASRILRQMHPGRPLYLLGESMGGAVATLAMTGALAGVPREAGSGFAGEPLAAADGVILSAPAVWGRATMDLLPRLALFAGARLFPDVTVTGSGLRIMASDNIPMLQALGRDPLVLKGARIDTVDGLVDLMDDALAAAPRLTAPTLLMYGAHDEVIPRAPITEFVAQLPQEARDSRRLAFYAHGYHLLLRDLEGAAVAGDVASWILDRTAPLPSNADATAAKRPWPPPDSDG